MSALVTPLDDPTSKRLRFVDTVNPGSVKSKVTDLIGRENRRTSNRKKWLHRVQSPLVVAMSAPARVPEKSRSSETGTRVAVRCSLSNKAAGFILPGPPAFCRTSAATAAASGAAALVPKKFG